MANEILTSFIRTMPRLQARNIEKDLQRPEERVRYRSSSEFRQAFQDQLRALLANDSDIRFESIELQTEAYRESDFINESFRLIAGDLSALFTEAAAFLELEELQAQIYNNEVVSRLQKAVAEAEAEVERLELLRGNVSGLKEALVEKFNSGADRLSRNSPHAQSTYIDPKLNFQPDPSLDMPIGLHVGGLVLPLKSGSAIPVGIGIVDINNRGEDGDWSLPEVIQTRDQGEFSWFGPTGNATNLLDGQHETVWQRSYYPPEILEGGAQVNVVLTIHPSSPAINYLEVHPVGEFDQELAEVHYENEIEQTIKLDLQASTVKLTEPVRLYFSEITARRVILTFRQRNSISVDRGAGASVQKYTFGLRDVSVGRSEYEQTGYFVSKTLALPAINKLFLKASENGFVGVPDGDPLSPDTNPLPLIEYWIAVREIDNAGTVVDSKFLPIMSVGASQVREKLEANQSGKANLSFMIDPAMLDASADLVVYRNGVAMIRGVDYEFEPPATPLAQQAVLSIPQGYRVRDEYVAKYTPLHTQPALAPVQFTDLTGLVRYNSDNTISLKRPQSSRAVSSEANLIIIMRGLGNGKHTAVVDDVTFAVG
jgi:hypothetical protein